MSEKVAVKNIADLEALVGKTESGEIEVLPNGSVIRLSDAELIRKNLRLAKEQTDVLLAEAKELREGLKRILAELDKLVRP